VISIIILSVVFILGFTAGIGLMFRLGIAREESDRSLLREPRSPGTVATRRLVGWYSCAPERRLHIDPLAGRANV
jgi:hypothetical protein